jgi:pyruvate,water dikinase
MAYQLGVFSRSERVQPRDPRKLFTQAFYGRLAIQMEFLAAIGDRTPGSSGREVVEGLFGRVPEEMSFDPTRRRYPVMAVRYPYLFLTTPSRLHTVARETDIWWRDRTARLSTMSAAELSASLAEAVDMFETTLTAQSLGLHACVQPLSAAVDRLIQRTGVGDATVFSGVGGAEMDIVGDIWSASRGELSIADLVDRHGFHGPHEGEVSSVVWREDPEPLRRMVSEYARRDDSEDPRVENKDHARRRAESTAALMSALPRIQRPTAKLILSLAAQRIPLRGVAKRAYLQSIDVARGSARALGKHLLSEGIVDDPDDVFYLGVDELCGAIPANARELVGLRRARRTEYQDTTIPSRWRGTPTPETIPEFDSAKVVSGIGVSSGSVTGVVRVVDDPTFVDVEPGEVLVATTTDPSWASIMFLAAALVTDIGGALSHAAVVARELGVPCVVNTGDGSRVLRTGDTVRVDGTNGTVEVVSRSETALES